jgi:FdhD protein
VHITPTGYDRNAGVIGVAAFRVERGERLAPRADELSVEEPLELRLAGDTLAVTMRTPGHDRELAAGFLLAEGLIRSRADLGSIAHCGRLGQDGYGNVIDVLPAPGVTIAPEALAGARRGTLTTAACGLCGRRLIDDLLAALAPPALAEPFHAAFIAGLPTELRTRQPDFERTGGLHAAGIAREGVGLLVVREDVGRHNAVDKAVGRLLLDGRLPIACAVLVVSGRVSFEIVQKALAAGLAGVVGVSAPSSLAVSTAARFGLLLAGFARGG